MYNAGALVRAARNRVLEHHSRLQEAWFDHKYGVDTRGIHDDLAAFGAGGEHLADAYGYEPVQFNVFRAIIKASAVAPGGRVFVDFGSGKGRALLLAALHGFDRVIGVELAPKLHEIAQRNAAALHRRRPLAGRIELHCADAVDLELPDADALLCFYNPFGERVLRKVAANIERAYYARPRQLVIAYRNAMHSGVLDALPFLRRVLANPSFSIYRTPADPAAQNTPA